MKIVLCQCRQAELIAPEIAAAALEAAKASGHKVVCVDDLCGLAASNDPLFAEWAAEDQLIVAACYPRAVKALFTHAGANLPENAQVINLRTAETPLEIKGSDPFSLQTEPAEPQIITAPDPEWIPWFPIIDYNRCKNCKQCLNFCLFGVYAQNSDGMVEVARPNKCKTGCPACARVCPFAAIIFPKYDKSPINGEIVNEAQWRISHAESAESLKDRLSGKNIYDMLKNRKPGAESVNPQNLEDLEKLKDQFDIPDDLFNK